MTSPQPPSWLDFKQAGEAAVVKLPAGDLYHDELIDVIGKELVRLIATSGCRRLVLDFGAVAHISSEMLGALIVAQKRLLDQGGRLILCGLNRDLREVFAMLRLEQVFTITGDEQEALGERR